MYLYLCNELAICSVLLVLLSQLAFTPVQSALKALCWPVGMAQVSTVELTANGEVYDQMG